MKNEFDNLYLFFDTETAGLPVNSYLPHTDTDNWPRLVSVAWATCTDDRDILEFKKYIIKPDGWKIPKGASDIHGITTEIAMRDGIDIKTVLYEFAEAMNKSKFIVGHNVRFDRNIMASEFYRVMPETSLNKKLYTMRYRDTMHVSKRLVAIPNVDRGGYKFPTLAETYEKLTNEKMENAHTAHGDLSATVISFWKLFDLGLVQEFYSTHKDRSDFIK